MSPPVVQQLDGMGIADAGTLCPVPASAPFHLARLWPVMVWPAQKCRVCFQVVEQDEAEPYTDAPVGWRHREGECPEWETVETKGGRL